MHEDFFVIYRDHDGGAQRGWLRWLVVALVVAALGLAVTLVSLQQTIAEDARFDFGKTGAYEGVLVGEPVPLLVTADRTYLLVNPLKYEFDPAVRTRLTGRSVRLEATLIERGPQAMLEVVEGSVTSSQDAAPVLRLPNGPSLGLRHIRGEIVDSKCYLGVMNPGHLKPHRACAVNCLRGGVPPVLLSTNDDGTTHQTVLVSPDGRPLQEWILPLVAEPVEVEGRVRNIGGLDVMEVEEGGVRRVK